MPDTQDIRVTIRDQRRRGFFTIDNEVVDDHRITGHALLVYVALCRYADNDRQDCRVTVRDLTAPARCSKSAVAEGLNCLVEVGLIYVEHRLKKPSVVTLLQVTKKSIPSDVLVCPPIGHSDTVCPPIGHKGGDVSTTRTQIDPNNLEVKTPYIQNSLKGGSGNLFTGELLEQLTPEQKEAKVIKKTFEYFIEKLGKNPALYTLTEKREKHIRARIKETLAKHKSRGITYGKVYALFKMAIDELAASDWHNARGQFSHQAKCNNLENVFSSEDRLEFWLQRVEEK